MLENAAQHAAGRVRITTGERAPSIVVEDDGKGIEPTHMSRVRERGTCLDEQGGGAGLGLAIVQDVLDAYGWGLELSKSELGGLKATIAPRSLLAEQPALSAEGAISSLTSPQEA